MDELGERLRAQGMRLTRPRERVVAAVATLGHATPDEVLAELGRDGGPVPPPSTVYRALEALEETGVLRHTHLHARAVSYQLADHADHIHLVCTGCGHVDQVTPDVGRELVDRVREQSGFRVALAHTALNGRCAQCQST